MSSKIIRGQTAAALGPVFGLTGQPKTCAPSAVQTDASPAPQPEPVPVIELSKAEQQMAEAFERGQREGRRAAAEEHEKALAALTAQTAKTAAQLARDRPRLRREAESDVVRLALAIAKRVIHREISLDPQAIQGLVRVAIDQMNDRDIVRIRTHPAHRDVVQRVLESAQLSGRVELTADSSFAFGDLILETAQGGLDASIESQLKEIDLGIADRLGR